MKYIGSEFLNRLFDSEDDSSLSLKLVLGNVKAILPNRKGNKTAPRFNEIYWKLINNDFIPCPD